MLLPVGCVSGVALTILHYTNTDDLFDQYADDTQIYIAVSKADVSDEVGLL